MTRQYFIVRENGDLKILSTEAVLEKSAHIIAGPYLGRGRAIIERQRLAKQEATNGE